VDHIPEIAEDWCARAARSLEEYQQSTRFLLLETNCPPFCGGALFEFERPSVELRKGLIQQNLILASHSDTPIRKEAPAQFSSAVPEPQRVKAFGLARALR